ncbi:MAG: hypothetical protein LAO77_07030 [Acidobacteriia bacterium]|nr:hypothetical protein [Terriglobia bacterium]
MTTRTLVLTSCLLAAAGFAHAQPPAAPRSPQPPAAPQAPAAPRAATAPPAAPQPAAPRKAGQPVNIRVEFTLTDQHGASPATKRTVSVVVADGMAGRVRSQSDVLGILGGVPLNIDTDPELLADGKIRLRFTLQYDWPAPVDAGERTPRGTVLKTAMNDAVALILESGKSMIAAQSADPIGDRQVTVEVKATVLK